MPIRGLQLDDKANRLYNFTCGLVTVFKIREGLRGKVDCQKTAYFMKRLGVDVPFSFKWNQFGPYSYDLAHYCGYLEAEGLLHYSGTYSLDEERAKYYSNRFDPQTCVKIKKFFQTVNLMCDQKGYDKVLFLECMASLDFIRQNSLRASTKNKTFFLLEKLKPQRNRVFSMMRNDAWYLLQAEGLR
jgi:hypothetical protein